jgi:CheY-like chemotaxis protein
MVINQDGMKPASTSGQSNQMTDVGMPLVAVIDDDEASAFALSLLLEDWGYEPVTGANADDVIRLLDARKGDDLQIIVTDFHLAGGHDGLAVIFAIREHQGRACPAVVITGSKGGRPARNAIEHGFPVLQKPFEPEHLRRCLAKLLEGGSSC